MLSRAQTPKPNVLLVTIDTVRADHVGAYGYTKPTTPTLDRLAREGVRFADATSQAPLTGPAHAAILTGSYPGRFGVRDNAAMPLPDSATTVAELFKAAGYRTGAFIGAFIVDRQYGFGQGFDEFDSKFERFTSAAKLQARRPAAAVVDDALKWLSTRSSAAVLRVGASIRRACAVRCAGGISARFPATPYDGALAYVDASVGRLIDALQQSGQLEQHDRLRRRRPRRRPRRTWRERTRIFPIRRHAARALDPAIASTEICRRGRERTGARDRRDCRRWRRSAASRNQRESTAKTWCRSSQGTIVPIRRRRTLRPSIRNFISGGASVRSVRVGEWKYIDAPKPELYHVLRDKGEQKNLVSARPPLAAGLAREAQRTEAGFGPAAAVVAPPPDPETLARLRSLGYVGATRVQAQGFAGRSRKI